MSEPQAAAQAPRRIVPKPMDAPLEPFIPRLRAHARARPDAVAVIDGARRLSWAELVDLIDRVAARLAALGLGRGDVVATLGEGSAEHLAVYLGAIAAGACAAPLPSGMRPEVLAAMLENAEARLLFATDAAMAQARAAAGAAPGCADAPVALDALEDWLAGARAQDAPEAPAGLDDPFDMIFSSGTTGVPKGIEHDHKFRLRQLRRMALFGYGPDVVSIASTPLCSNTTLVAALPTLAEGGTLALMRKFDAEGFLRLAQAHRATHAMLVPVQYRRILDAPGFDAADLSSFRVKLSTSAPLPVALKREILARWPGELIEIYGMTEGGLSTILDCRAHPDKLHTVGRPAEGADILIVDEEMRPLPPGEVGEILGRSPMMMTWYRNAPDKTREAIWRSPEGEDWIRTGDMGRLDPDGFLELLDRRKDMIISGGFNVFAADLERELLAHPDVAEAAVIGVPSREWGETPLALVVPRAGARPDPEALREWVNARLGKVQRISRIELRESLPRSEIGKVLKRELRAPYWKEAAGG
ncbi:class I adenylate-forming enzyme family protein [Oceanicella actignis]|uniref:class I adenylate-forming enzyme family protein n=1 Tax=Oceanicella actignis TaxID=1189325 RepID=UPI0012544207|nr:AMP-binding protein [Oceanicella actignis]TYO89124.1 acyl-CoA synthetase (AMP-forming)/AMP-acid ligase II [Oceanicella actignis]